jgi:DNA-binding transcriptional MerR regulator
VAEVTIDEARRGLDEREERPMSIGDLAGELGVTTRTIRFYEVKGLIAPRRRNDNARVYGRRDRGRLILILRAKNLGFTLEEIREYLDLYDADPSQLTQTKHLIGKVQAAIADLKRKREGRPGEARAAE